MASPIPIQPSTRTSTASTFYLAEPWSSTSPIPCPPRTSDSGYGTATNVTPIGSTTKLTNASAPGPQSDLAHSNIRAVPLPGREDLSIFRTDVEPAYTARFREVAPEMQRLLQRHVVSAQKGLFQRRGRVAAMSMRLMTVGRTLESARPAIVVFVSGGTGLEGVLEGEMVRRLYRPGDGVMPDFDVVVVVGQAPRKRARVVWDTGLAGERRELVTYCGVQVYLEEGGRRSAMATLGGVVKLTYGPGDFVLLGMTVGHVLEGLFGPELGEEEDAPGFMYPRVMGKVAYPATQPDMHVSVDDIVPPRDWALFEIDSSLKIKPNLIQRAGSSYRQGAEPARRHNGIALTTAPAGSFPDIKPIEVVLLGGSNRSRGSMLGLLSHLPGGIMLSGTADFVETYLLTLDDGLEIQDGDSGSWVANPISMEVYGHVVATDMTGDAYVVPLHSSFAEMKTRLGVESVDLPTTADLLDAALRTTSTAGLAPAINILPMEDEERRQGQESTWRDIQDGNRERRDWGWGVLTIRGCSRERRASELLSLCEGLRGQEWKRLSVLDDGDSGYGSLGTPELFDDSVQAEGVRVY
ncbi:hypothetical protein B0T25DRAFT_549121 [Lasiosphaeria hispida]|uniref:Uncharacterized protein n=1 Tax=Lasiosphaeria hispida TaxID=260671 RepID=A0AAJ0HFG6_9PEZI|nr:hypothetical protein B0T25DRAFT_549121 [Lasiosphaeria hispida]